MFGSGGMPPIDPMTGMSTANSSPFGDGSDIKLLINTPECPFVRLDLIEALTLMQTGQKDRGLEKVNKLLLASKISF